MNYLHKDFFTLFGLEKIFQLDQNQLDKAYLALQIEYHPDRAAHLAPAAQNHYLHVATHINKAYQTLKYPLSRAQYLLQLAEVKIDEPSYSAVPTDFLVEQMQWREAIEAACNAKNTEELAILYDQLQSKIASVNQELSTLLSKARPYDPSDLAQAAILTREYCFYEKLEQTISEVIDPI